MMKSKLLSLKSLVLVAILSVVCCQISLAKTAQDEAAPIKGIVKDETGTPLIGASVLVEGTTVGVSTGIDGSFTVNAKTTDKLNVSYVGCIGQTILVGTKTMFDIVLKSDAGQLDEVIVVGFGTQKKANLSGSVASAGAEVLESRPIANVGQGLQGVIPNLNIDMGSTGDPTSSPKFNIRGAGSITGNSAPLVLVDGIEMNVNDLNPNDIKSISVLKDAGAAAIYGARAAFGVILIETKGAEEGSKPRVQFNAELAFNDPIINTDLVSDPYQYATMRNTAVFNMTGKKPFDDDYLAKIKAYQDDPANNPAYELINGNSLRNYAPTDYFDRLLAPVSPQQKYDISLSGSGKANRYYASVGYFDQDGVFACEGNDKFRRINAILKNDADITDWLTADSKVVFNSKRSDKLHDYDKTGSKPSFQSIYRATPLAMLEIPEGVKGYEDMAGAPVSNAFNFIPYLEQGGRNINKDNTLVLSQGLTATPMEGWKIRGEFSYRNRSMRQDDVASKVTMARTSDLNRPDYGVSTPEYVTVSTAFDQYYTFNAYSEYAKDINEHSFKVMAGYNYECGHYSAATATAYDFASSSVNDLDATTGTQMTKGGQNEIALMGIFYRANYSYDERYLIELNGRYDGTSRFPSDSRFGFFPSFSGAWRISEENFMAGTRNWLDNLKLRVSYGALGNQSVAGYYPYISTMPVTSNSYLFDAGSTYTTEVGSPGLVSPSLTWETVSTINYGIDAAMFDNKLNVSFDKYTRDTKDMLMQVTYPDALGVASPYENGADLRTKGWELAITYRNSIGTDFNYTITAGLSDNKTVITKYNNPTGTYTTFYEGKELGEIWGYKTLGILQTEEDVASMLDQSAIHSSWKPGDMQYQDLNGDGKITPGGNTLNNHGDKTRIGNTTPRYAYSLGLNLNYKAFGLDMFWQGVGKRDFLPEYINYTMFYPYTGESILNSWVDDCWSETNRDAYFSRPILNDKKIMRNYQPQSRYVQDASYLRLKSLVLSYSLPQKFLDKVGIGAARVSLSGSNLLTFSKVVAPLDPEYMERRVDYPFMKTYSLSLSLTL